MLLSAGLLLIYVILCIVSFITARKEMAEQVARDAAKKAAVLKKAANRKDTPDTDTQSKKKDKDIESNDAKKDASEKKKLSEQPKKENLEQPKKDSAPEPIKSESSTKEKASPDEPAKTEPKEEKPEGGSPSSKEDK